MSREKCNPFNFILAIDFEALLLYSTEPMGDFLTVAQFAKKLGVTPATVYAAIEQDRVQYTKILGRLGIPKTELTKFKRRKSRDDTFKVLRAA